MSYKKFMWSTALLQRGRTVPASGLKKEPYVARIRLPRSGSEFRATSRPTLIHREPLIKKPFVR